MKRPRFLMLGGQPGWHFDQLTAAATRRGASLELATYESLTSTVNPAAATVKGNSSPDTVFRGTVFRCSAGDVNDFDAVLTRTMPPGSLEQITFRLASLHRIAEQIPVINPASSLELAIDKFATLAVVHAMGYPVPETVVTQDRSIAIKAFDQMGGDCVVKPLFGGEGFGVMRVQHRELAKTTFATLVHQNAVVYLQRFIPPGGADLRLLRFGADTPCGDATRRVIAIARSNRHEFRTNTTCGGQSRLLETQTWHLELADRICERLGLTFAAVDLIEEDSPHHKNPSGIADGFRVIEVNGIPGWKHAQSVCQINMADLVVQCLMESTER